ncbi:MAG: 3-hydroxyacyl-ACP dehydratase FabZ [Proteobacteria bacterium]|nr:3-hydroxyacyl-ACP dehydratase FabZ [Pseudomonadota bacterium]
MIDIKQIMEYIPHRYPFLLIDRVLEMEKDKRIVAIKNVTINEPFFQGHFPGQPIMPGVLLIEAMAQAWGILAISSSSQKVKSSDILFIGIDKARFRRPVHPGDQVRFELEGIGFKRLIWKFRGKAFVDDNLVAEAELMATMAATQMGKPEDDAAGVE